MALFKMRDSWNVWRRKVDEALGGSVEPVKSEDVTYDNTDSGLTATNVQSAIDEVAKGIGDIDSALSGKTVITEPIATIEVTGDGTKTVLTLMDELATALKAKLASLEDNELLTPLVFYAAGFAWMGATTLECYDKTTTSFSPLFQRMTIDATSSLVSLYYAVLKSTTGDSWLNGCTLRTAPSITVASGLNNIPTNGAKFQLIYRLYETLE